MLTFYYNYTNLEKKNACVVMYKQGNVFQSNQKIFFCEYDRSFFFTRTRFNQFHRNITPLAILKIHNGAKYGKNVHYYII